VNLALSQPELDAQDVTPSEPILNAVMPEPALATDRMISGSGKEKQANARHVLVIAIAQD